MLEPSEDVLDVCADLWEDFVFLLPTILLADGPRVLQHSAIPVIGHVHDIFLRSDGNLFQDLDASMLTDVVANHDAMGLLGVSFATLASERVDMPRDE